MAVSATVTPGKIFTDGESITISELNKLGNPTVDISGAVGTLSLSDGSVTNAKVAASAGVQLDKLETGTDAQMIVGSATGVAAWKSISGDVAITNAGVVTIASNAVTLGKLEDGTQGDILYYGASGAPTRLAAGTSGHFLKTQGAGANPVWVDHTITPSIKAVRSVITGSDTYYGGDSSTDGSQNLDTTSVSLVASTTYLLEWGVNLVENIDASGTTAMAGEVDFSTDDVTYTKMYDAKQFHRKEGGSGHRYDRNHHLNFIHGFTTNGTGGTYYFRFDTNTTSDWTVHDMHLKIMEVSDFSGQTYTQA